jgi:CRISPR-associated protein Cas5d
MYHIPLQVKVWGPMACFTRSEQKVERVSYEVMTPSAARGILEAIFWKPEFIWHVRQIAVLNPIRHISLLRNEIKSRLVAKTVKQWAENQGRGGFRIEDDRTQRHTLALRDVSYLISADIRLARGVELDAAKYRDQFRRRVERGQCYSMPYLGCREFSASFAPPDGTEQPQDINIDLGLMLFDLNYRQDGTGRGTPRFFPAILEHGVLSVPAQAPLPGNHAKDLV